VNERQHPQLDLLTGIFSGGLYAACVTKAATEAANRLPGAWGMTSLLHLDEIVSNGLRIVGALASNWLGNHFAGGVGEGFKLTGNVLWIQTLADVLNTRILPGNGVPVPLLDPFSYEFQEMHIKTGAQLAKGKGPR